MAEEATTTIGAEEPRTEGAQAPSAGDGFQPITSQEQLNAVLRDRLARERGKVRERYADYDDLKERAGAADRLRADLAPRTPGPRRHEKPVLVVQMVE